MKPEISVLICTWNRSWELDRTLRHLESQTLDSDRFEVVVVDNNSSDDTADVIRQRASEVRYPLVYVSETRQGKTWALNAGISQASAEVIACTDDDCLPEPNWLEVILETFKDQRVGVLGGPGLSVFSEAVKRDERRLFLGKRFLGDFSPYDELTEVFKDNPPLGLNLSFRKEVAEKIGGFDTKLGPVGSLHWGREENAFVCAAQQAGYRVFFQPKAIVHHYLGDDRVTWKAIKKQSYQSGVGTYAERYAPRVQGRVHKKVFYTVLFGSELAYSSIRYCIFYGNYRRRTVASFRAIASVGKLKGLRSDIQSKTVSGQR